MHVRGALAATATPGHRRCTMTAPQMPHELALVPGTRHCRVDHEAGLGSVGTAHLQEGARVVSSLSIRAP